GAFPRARAPESRAGDLGASRLVAARGPARSGPARRARAGDARLCPSQRSSADAQAALTAQHIADLVPFRARFILSHSHLIGAADTALPASPLPRFRLWLSHP